MLWLSEFVVLDREANGAKEDGAGLRRGGMGRPKQSKQGVKGVRLLRRIGEMAPERIGIRRKIGALCGGSREMVQEIKDVLWLEKRIV
jgi:hypothetical protein